MARRNGNEGTTATRKDGDRMRASRDEEREDGREGRSSLGSVAKITEISSESPESFDEAIRLGIERASRTLQNVEGAWVKEQSIVVRDGEPVAYRVHLKLTFVLQD